MEEKKSEHELDAKVEDYLNSLSLRAMHVGGITAHAHDRDTSERERREGEEGRQRESWERERREGIAWTMHVSKSSGKPYWFNRITGINKCPCATTYCNMYVVYEDTYVAVFSSMRTQLIIGTSQCMLPYIRVSLHYYICVLILLYMCPHKSQQTDYTPPPPHTHTRSYTIYVSSYYYAS
jgi:hypothetical protein